MKITIFTLLVSLLFLSSPASANPASCPSVSAIKSAVFTSVVTMGNQGYVASQSPSRYDTNDLWQFGLLFIPGLNDQDVLAKANKSIQSLSGTPQPAFSTQYNNWYCIYSVDEGYLAIAALISTT